MHRFLSLLIASVLIALLPGESPAQPFVAISPDGEAYTPAGDQPDYRWFANTQPADGGEDVILRDGAASWEVTEPDACRFACEAFMGCTAFLYVEPRLKNQKPRCQMLKGVRDPAVGNGVHLYRRN